MARKLILARSYEDAYDFAKVSGWLLNAWKFVRGIDEIIGANATTEVYVLPFAGKARHFADALRGLMARGAIIHDLTLSAPDAAPEESPNV